MADQVFVVAVHVCCVPEGLPELVGAVEDREALRVAGDSAVEGGEAHGAETEGGDGGAVGAEGTGWGGGGGRRHCLVGGLLGIGME